LALNGLRLEILGDPHYGEDNASLPGSKVAQTGRFSYSFFAAGVQKTFLSANNSCQLSLLLVARFCIEQVARVL